MTGFPRLRRLVETVGRDRKFARLGWRRGTFFLSYYRGRLRDHIRRDAPPAVKRFGVRHGVSAKNMELALRLDPGGGDWVVVEGVWLHQDYHFPELRDCRSILDLGANIGVAAVWFAGLNPGVRLACVEADCRNIPLLRRNLDANAVDARILECAVSTQRGEARLGIGADHGVSALEGSGFHPRSRYQAFVTVPTYRVPDLLDMLEWEQVDLIKMDIEGMERAILSDAGDWLSRTKAIVMEVHEAGAERELADILARSGWSLTRLNAVEEITCLARPA